MSSLQLLFMNAVFTSNIGIPLDLLTADSNLKLGSSHKKRFFSRTQSQRDPTILLSGNCNKVWALGGGGLVLLRPAYAQEACSCFFIFRLKMQRHTFPELLYSTYAQLLLIRLFRTGNIVMEANSFFAVVLFCPSCYNS